MLEGLSSVFLCLCGSDGDCDCGSEDYGVIHRLRRGGKRENVKGNRRWKWISRGGRGKRAGKLTR